MLVSLLCAAPASAQGGGAPRAEGSASVQAPPPGSASSLVVSPFGVESRAREPLFAARAEPSYRLDGREAGYRVGRYAMVGAVAGGVVGLGYGLAYGDNSVVALSPAIETVIGLGAGLIVGAVVDLVRAGR